MKITCYKELEKLTPEEQAAWLAGVKERYAQRHPRLETHGVKSTDFENEFMTVLCNRHGRPLAAFFTADYQQFVKEDGEPDYARTCAVDFKCIIVGGKRIESLF